MISLIDFGFKPKKNLNSLSKSVGLQILSISLEYQAINMEYFTQLSHLILLAYK